MKTIPKGCQTVAGGRGVCDETTGLHGGKVIPQPEGVPERCSVSAGHCACIEKVSNGPISPFAFAAFMGYPSRAEASPVPSAHHHQTRQLRAPQKIALQPVV